MDDEQKTIESFTGWISYYRLLTIGFRLILYPLSGTSFVFEERRETKG